MTDQTYNSLDWMTGLPILFSVPTGLALGLTVGLGHTGPWVLFVGAGVVGAGLWGQWRLQRTETAARIHAARVAASDAEVARLAERTQECKRCGQTIWKPRILCDVCRGGKVEIDIEKRVIF